MYLLKISNNRCDIRQLYRYECLMKSQNILRNNSCIEVFSRTKNSNEIQSALNIWVTSLCAANLKMSQTVSSSLVHKHSICCSICLILFSGAPILCQWQHWQHSRHWRQWLYVIAVFLFWVSPGMRNDLDFRGGFIIV